MKYFYEVKHLISPSKCMHVNNFLILVQYTINVNKILLPMGVPIHEVTCKAL